MKFIKIELPVMEPRMPPIRSSSIELMEHCRRKFYYREMLGIRGCARSASLDTGTFFHSGMQLHFQGFSEESVLVELDKQRDRLVTAIHNKPGPFGNPQAELEELDLCVAKAKAMLVAVFKNPMPIPQTWSIPRLTLPGGEVAQLIDKSFTFTLEFPAELNDTNLPLLPAVFKPDLVLADPVHKHLWIVDHKTTSMSTSAFASSRRLGVQAQHYAFGVNLLTLMPENAPWCDYRVAGVWHQVVKVPNIKYCPETKDKNGIKSYADRVLKWYSEQDEAPIITSQSFFQEPPPKSFIGGGSAWVAELKNIRVSIAGSLYNRYDNYVSGTVESADAMYPAGGSKCLSFNKVCEYVPFCSSDEAKWPLIVATGVDGKSYEISFREDEEAAEKN